MWRETVRGLSLCLKLDGSLGRGLVVNYEHLLVTGGKCPLLRGPEMARHWSYSCLTTSCHCITNLPSQGTDSTLRHSAIFRSVPAWLYCISSHWPHALVPWALLLRATSPLLLGRALHGLTHSSFRGSSGDSGRSLQQFLTQCCVALFGWEPQSRENSAFQYLLNIKKYINFILCVWIFTCMWVYATHVHLLPVEFSIGY